METKKKEVIKEFDDSGNGLFRQVLNMFSLNIRALLSNRTLVIQVLWMLAIALLLPICLIPFWAAGGALIAMYLILPILVIMGNIGYVVRRSTLYNNIQIVVSKKYIFNLSNLLTVFFIGNILTIITWFFLVVLGWNGVLLSDWAFFGAPRLDSAFILANGAYINLIYITELACLLSFSLYYLLHGYVKTTNLYYTIVLAILVIGIIFGGSLNTYFSMPAGNDVHLNNIEGSMYAVDGSFYINEDYYFNGGVTDPGSKAYFEANWDVGTLIPASGLFPDSMFIPSLLTPTYGVGEFLNCAVCKLNSANWTYDVYVVDAATFDGIVAAGDLTAFNPELPVVVEIFNTMDLNNRWNVYQMNFTYSSNSWFWAGVLIQPYAWILASYFLGTAGQKYINN